LEKEIRKAANRFYKKLKADSNPSPSSGRLFMFRVSRNLVEVLAPEFRDYQYYKENGWFESDYYYETDIGLLKKFLGAFGDFLGKHIAQNQ
jgi:hypothetical protein